MLNPTLWSRSFVTGRLVGCNDGAKQLLECQLRKQVSNRKQNLQRERAHERLNYAQG